MPKASDMVVAAIRNRILEERLPVGYRLASEAELLAEFGLGRATVREGLRLLERDGLIDIKRGPGGGITVQHPDISRVSDAFSILFQLQGVTLREFLEFRVIVEPPAAAMAAERATELERDAIQESARQDAQLSTVVDLHVLIGKCAGNGVVSNVLQALQTPFAVHFRSKKIQEEHTDATRHAHTRIAAAIAAGDGARAQKAMKVHLDAYGDYLAEMNLLDEPIIPDATRLSP